MKAKEYASKLTAENKDEVVAELALETRELIDSRIKNSTKESKGGAVDGALREQRQKWNAICDRNNILSPAEFDNMLVAHLNDVVVQQNVWKGDKQEKKAAATEKEKPSVVKDGRCLTTPISI